MKKVLAILLFVILLVGSELQAQNAPTAELRTWTDTTGKFQVQATLVRVLQDRVVLRTADNSNIEVTLAKLSPADIAHACYGFRFQYTPGKGFMSLDELGKAYLNAIKNQDGGAILNMYIPREVISSTSQFIAATDERKKRALESWESEFKDEEDPRGPQGQRVAHFLNGEFQRRKTLQGFDLANVQFVETRYGGSLFADNKADGDLFANNPQIIFQLPEYPGRLFYIEMEDCAKVRSRWYIARFGNTLGVFGFCLPKSPQESAKTKSTIERLMKPFENLKVTVSLRDYSDAWRAGVKREEDGTLVFNHRDAQGKTVYSPIRELPADVYVYSLRIEGKKSTASSGILEILAVLKEIPTVRDLAIREIPDDAAAVVDAIVNASYNLESITLSGIPSLSDADAARVFSRHRLVSEVWIVGCPNVGSKTTRQILSGKFISDLSLWGLQNDIGDLESLAKSVDLYKLYLYSFSASSIDVQRLLAQTTAQRITLMGTTLTPADLRTLKIAPEMPWDWRFLTLGGPAFKGLSDEKVLELETEYYRNNPGPYGIKIDTF